MTSLTKAVEIKIEDSAANARYEPEMSLDLQPDLDSLRNSSISAHELDDGLGLFHCTEDDPGPSKTSDDENNPSGHGKIAFLFLTIQILSARSVFFSSKELISK